MTPGRQHCSRCTRPLGACICRWITPLDSLAGLLILQHPMEVANAKGSARLLHLSVQGSVMVSGEVFDAEYALRIDLIHELAPADGLDAAVERALHFLGKGGPVAQREAKQLALRQAGMTLDAQLARDRDNADLIARLRVSPEGQEGLTAFLDKRPPRWVG